LVSSISFGLGFGFFLGFLIQLVFAFYCRWQLEPDIGFFDLSFCYHRLLKHKQDNWILGFAIIAFYSISRTLVFLIFLFAIIAC